MYIHSDLLNQIGTHLSSEGILHLATVEYLDITNIKGQYLTGALESWKFTASMKRARSGVVLFSPQNGILTAIGGWPLTKPNITVEMNKNLLKGSEWFAVDTCSCFRYIYGKFVNVE